jgi:hypothetical protein
VVHHTGVGPTSRSHRLRRHHRPVSWLGSTLIAADKTGRVHRSVEFGPLYAECDRAALRGRAGNQAVRLPHQVPNEHAENTRNPKVDTRKRLPHLTHLRTVSVDSGRPASANSGRTPTAKSDVHHRARRMTFGELLKYRDRLFMRRGQHSRDSAAFALITLRWRLRQRSVYQ